MPAYRRPETTGPPDTALPPVERVTVAGVQVGASATVDVEGDDRAIERAYIDYVCSSRRAVTTWLRCCPLP